VFDCETYALDNKSVVYTRSQARTLGRRKKDVAQSFGVHDEGDGSLPVKVFSFLRKFAKARDDNDIFEGEACYILQDCTKKPLKSEVLMVMPTCPQHLRAQGVYQGARWMKGPHPPSGKDGVVCQGGPTGQGWCR